MKNKNPILDTLVDITAIDIDTSKPLKERQIEFAKLIKNPNQFRVKDIVVNINYVGEGHIEDKLADYIKRQMSQ